MVSPPPVPGHTAGGALGEASHVQRFLWEERHAGRGAPGAARALRLRGRIDTARLEAAAQEVAGALEIIRTGFAAGAPVLAGPRTAAVLTRARVTGTAAERDRQCAEILRRDRDKAADPAQDPLARFHLIDCGGGETVLGVVADPLILDLRSAYLVLGAVMQAYFGRFRAAQYPLFDPATGTSPPRIHQARLGWWSRRLQRWAEEAGRHGPGRARQPGVSSMRTMELALPGERWAALCQAGTGGGNAGALAVIALLTWWFRTAAPVPRPAVFGSTLDLRDYAGLGPAVGPLTDRIVFAVDAGDFAELTFADLVFRAHAGLLDAVVHYLPYRDIVALGTHQGILPPTRPARYWDVAIHYCRTPPASAYTRGEETLARRGLSIELFCESVLAAAPACPAGTDGTAMEVQLAESGTQLALVVSFDPLAVPGEEVAAMLADLDGAAGAVAADPQIPLLSLQAASRSRRRADAGGDRGPDHLPGGPQP